MFDQPSAPAARLQLRPGLTGWAQIKGGRHISSEDKAALDLWYIKNASFALDMMILAHTVRIVLLGDRVDQNAIQEAWVAIRDDQASLLPVEGLAKHRLEAPVPPKTEARLSTVTPAPVQTNKSAVRFVV